MRGQTLCLHLFISVFNDNKVENNTKNKFTPKVTVLLFILIVLISVFFNSKKILNWGVRDGARQNNVFQNAVLSYAGTSEKLKSSSVLEVITLEEENLSSQEKNLPAVVQVSQEQIPKTAPTDPVAELPQKTKYKTLIVGDSFVYVGGGVGEILEKALLKYKNLEILRSGAVSSGLSRPDYFDWQSKAVSLKESFHPDIVIVMIGTNDAQSITDTSGKVLFYYKHPEWNNAYASRVREFIDHFQESRIFWIGLPVMKEPNYSSRILNLDSIYQNVAENFLNMSFISTWNLLSDSNGQYSGYLPDENGKMINARQKDGIHLTTFGGNIVSKEVIKQLGATIKLTE